MVPLLMVSLIHLFGVEGKGNGIAFRVEKQQSVPITNSSANDSFRSIECKLILMLFNLGNCDSLILILNSVNVVIDAVLNLEGLFLCVTGTIQRNILALSVALIIPEIL